MALLIFNQGWVTYNCVPKFFAQEENMKVQLELEREEKERVDELLELGRPNAPSPNSLYYLSGSSHGSQRTVLSQVLVEKYSI